MRVRADDSAHLAVQHARERHFLGGGLGVEVNKDEPGPLPQPLHLGQDAMEWIVQCRHKGAPLEVDDRRRRAFSGLKKSAPLPWRAGRIVQWTKEPAFAIKVFQHLSLVPD